MTVIPTPQYFWTTSTLDPIRQAEPDPLLLALYLLTNLYTNALGIYYLPLTTIQADTRLPPNRLAFALDQLIDHAFCRYNTQRAYIWVCDAVLSPWVIPSPSHTNPLIKQVQALWSILPLDWPFLGAFYERHASHLQLDTLKQTSVPA